MSRMLSKMNLISVVQQLPKEDIETIQGYVEMIEEENQALKKKYENAVADYETTMFEKEQLNSLVNSCQEEIRQLKKQVEEYKEQVNKGLYNTCLPYSTGYNKAIKESQQENQELKKQLKELKEEKQEWINLLDMFKNQQRKFIQYLEDLIKQNETVVEVSKYGLPKNCSKLLIDFYKEILSKYKEIIGGKDEDNKQ